MNVNFNDICIRNATADDCQQLADWWNDGKVMAHAGFPNGIGTSAEEIISQISNEEDSKGRTLIIEYRRIPIGEMNYHTVKENTVEIGIKICDFDYQGKGLGPIILSIFIKELFSMGYTRIVLDTNLKNERAQHVYEQLGFRKLRVNIDEWEDQLGVLQSSVDYDLTPELFRDLSVKSHQDANAYLQNLCSQDTFKIVYEDIILRDMVKSDIEDDIRWNTTETEWALWDAPWEMEEAIVNFDPEEYRKKEEQRIIDSKDRTLDDFRWQLELDYIDGTHIGSVNTYLIDENYEWISKGNATGTYFYALGIEINEPSFWNKGIGKTALAAYIKYHISHNHLNLALQTWSGNLRMINCAQHIGFKEVNREKDFRFVGGEHYDGLTFLLDIDLFNSVVEQ